MGTSIFNGILADDWQDLRSNYKIAAGKIIDNIDISLRSRWNSKMARIEKEKFKEKVAETKIEHDPIFVLGHWRSGTTMLHNYLCQDSRYAFPNLFEAYNPHTFLYLEPKIQAKLAKKPPKARPMDNVRVGYDSPAEDEFALALLCKHSPLLGWVFPHHRGEFDHFLSMETVSKDQLEEWKNSFVHFIKKLTLFYNRQIILKSPHHTARIPHLLSLFPNAKFIHLHRNPYRVFQSTRNLYDSTVSRLSLQSGNRVDDDYIIKTYKCMFDNFIKNSNLIPSNNFIEVCFEDFILDPILELCKVYDQLSLEPFDKVESAFNSYKQSLGSYKQNTHLKIKEGAIKKLNTEWDVFFKLWNYQQKYSV